MDEATVITWLDNDYYEVLGVPRDAKRTDIARAFRAAARAHHPDTGAEAADTGSFIRAQEAFTVLGDEETRTQYDEVHRVADHLRMLAARKAEIDEADAWIPAYAERLQMRMEFTVPMATMPMAAMANPWQAFMPWNPWLAPRR